MNWYNFFKSSSRYRWGKPSKKVRAADYLKFMGDYRKGIKNELLLNRMLDDLESVIEYIALNSDIRHHPDHVSPDCPKCSDTNNDMPYFDESGRFSPEHQEVLKMCRLNYKKLIAKSDTGFWVCPNCCTVIGWEEYMSQTKDEKGKWMYSDAASWLMKKFEQARHAGDLGERIVNFEMIMEFVHGSGPQSNWFIEGGTGTINEVKQMFELPGYEKIYEQMKG